MISHWEKAEDAELNYQQMFYDEESGDDDSDGSLTDAMAVNCLDEVYDAVAAGGRLALNCVAPDLDRALVLQAVGIWVDLKVMVLDADCTEVWLAPGMSLRS